MKSAVDEAWAVSMVAGAADAAGPAAGESVCGGATPCAASRGSFGPIDAPFASDDGSPAPAAPTCPLADSVTPKAAPQRGQKAWPGATGAEQLLQTVRSTTPASASGQMRECPQR